jgi:hypothetical protein
MISGEGRLGDVNVIEQNKIRTTNLLVDFLDWRCTIIMKDEGMMTHHRAVVYILLDDASSIHFLFGIQMWDEF